MKNLMKYEKENEMFKFTYEGKMDSLIKINKNKRINIGA
jgi:hypothetical protein